MSVEVTDAEIEAVARAMVYADFPSFGKPEIDEMWDGWAHRARAAIIALDEVRASNDTARS